eukprot:symbB.v1.2.020712.t1/scaffold1752.1/size160374/3
MGSKEGWKRSWRQCSRSGHKGNKKYNNCRRPMFLCNKCRERTARISKSRKGPTRHKSSLKNNRGSLSS